MLPPAGSARIGTSPGSVSGRTTEPGRQGWATTGVHWSSAGTPTTPSAPAPRTTDQVSATIGMAIMMGGGPAAVYGAEALDALHQFETSA